MDRSALEGLTREHRKRDFKQTPARLRMTHSWIVSLLVWTAAVLAVGSALVSFPKHRQVEEMGDTVTLTCHTDFKGPIQWTHSVEGDLDHEGKDLTLPDFNEAMTGTYSCWDEGRLLHSLHVFLADIPDSTTPELKCWAENYNCSFQCSWVHPHYAAVRLRNERDSGEWVSPSSEGVFRVSHSTDHSSEDLRPLKLTLEALNQERILQLNKTFYLRDIIHPPSPKLQWSVSAEGEVLEVDLQPADSWATPTSYYPLEYQIEYLKKDNGKKEQQLCCEEEEKQCWTEVKCQVHVRVTRFRVRSRDPLVKSHWGQWTSWENVGKKGSKKGKNG
ncbi:interleukin-12 subunit beta, partial [Clupea harengus]|uniref:Interleukin-12 subunit beta n=1 Tax=Clupea harengus TaxID=7950 RepID=A0A6P8F4K2_CLUHA